ncbi:MAG: cbb3-type cytochrome c oxidase subunit 3 [Gammaproteobacteria bacterium]|nr:cbb3-type cytochrome c oxidase subunit 3 [Gammaproteobacteria bacterium]
MMWFHIIWTIVLFVVFLAIIRWAWSRGRRDEFREASHIPLEDDREVRAHETSRRPIDG